MVSRAMVLEAVGAQQLQHGFLPRKQPEAGEETGRQRLLQARGVGEPVADGLLNRILHWVSPAVPERERRPRVRPFIHMPAYNFAKVGARQP